MLLTLSGAKPQPCRSCTARCAWGRRGARRPGSLPRSPPPASSPAAAGRGDGGSAGRGGGSSRLSFTPGSLSWASPKSTTSAAPQLPPRGRSAPRPPAGIPPPRGARQPSPRLLAVVQPGELRGWVGNETAVWAVVPGQVHRSGCRVKYSNLSFAGCVRLHSYAHAPSYGELVI